MVLVLVCLSSSVFTFSLPRDRDNVFFFEKKTKKKKKKKKTGVEGDE